MKTTLVLLLIALLSTCHPRNGYQMPALDLLLIDSVTHLNTEKIPEGKPVALLYFSPDCIHCQKETEGIIEKMDSLKNVQFYFITGDPLERIIVYNKMFHLYKYPNIVLTRDYKFSFPGRFKDVAPPYLVICDEYKRIRGVFPGEIRASEIISFVNRM